MNNNPFWHLGQTAPSTIWTGQMSGSQYAAQQAQQAQAFALFSKQNIERRDWMIDGRTMTFKEFADTLFPEDTAERTAFFLKYSK